MTMKKMFPSWLHLFYAEKVQYDFTCPPYGESTMKGYYQTGYGILSVYRHSYDTGTV